MVSSIPKYQQCLGGTCVDCRRRPEITHSLAEKRNRYRATAPQNDIAMHRDLELQLQSRPDKRIVPLRRRFGFRCTNPKALDDSSSAGSEQGCVTRFMNSDAEFLCANRAGSPGPIVFARSNACGESFGFSVTVKSAPPCSAQSQV